MPCHEFAGQLESVDCLRKVCGVNVPLQLGRISTGSASMHSHWREPRRTGLLCSEGGDPLAVGAVSGGIFDPSCNVSASVRRRLCGTGLHHGEPCELPTVVTSGPWPFPRLWHDEPARCWPLRLSGNCWATSVVVVQSLLTQTDDGDASILAIAVALPEALADEYASRLRLDPFS